MSKREGLTPFECMALAVSTIGVLGGLVALYHLASQA